MWDPIFKRHKRKKSLEKIKIVKSKRAKEKREKGIRRNWTQRTHDNIYSY